MIISIENVASNATEQEVRHLFTSHGRVVSVQLLPGASGRTRGGCGLVEMEGENAEGIVRILDRCLFKGQVLRLRPVGTDRAPAGRTRETADSLGRTDWRTLYVDSVEQVTDRMDDQSDSWCRYTISGNGVSITGLHQGSVSDVTRYAQETVDAFNQRNGRGQRKMLSWSSRDRH